MQREGLIQFLGVQQETLLLQNMPAGSLILKMHFKKHFEEVVKAQTKAEKKLEKFL